MACILCCCCPATSGTVLVTRHNAAASCLATLPGCCGLRLGPGGLVQLSNCFLHWTGSCNRTLHLRDGLTISVLMLSACRQLICPLVSEPG